MSDRIKARMKLDNAGLTLVEILVSMVVFAIMLFPMLTGFNSLLKQNKTAKVTQAEVDYAGRVIEQFKQFNPDVTDEDPTTPNETMAGYSVNASDVNGIVEYTLENIKFEQDIVESANKTYKVSADSVRSINDTDHDTSQYEYRVTVSMDPNTYASSDGNITMASAGATYQYIDPNNTLAYNLDNIDERFCVLIRDASLNYDSRAINDLIDKAAKQLKQDDPARYNMWMSGVVNVFVNAKYFKNTYIKMSKNAAGDYVVDVTVNYTMYGYKNANVTYNIIRNRIYKKEETGNKPPKIYYYYNQFTQNNLVTPDSDTISLDNSGMVSGGNIDKNDQINIYLIKSDITTNAEEETEVYTRKPGLGQSFKGWVIPASGEATLASPAFETSNTEGSMVYTAELGNGASAKTYYYWPSYVTSIMDSSALSYSQICNLPNVKSISKKLNRKSGPNAIVRETRDDGSFTGLYYIIYNDVMVDSTMPHAIPSNEYEESISVGDEVYVCRRDVTTDYDPNIKFEKGDVIFRNKERFFVFPDGTVVDKAADIDSFSKFIVKEVNSSIHNKTFIIARSEKISYVNRPINIVLGPGSKMDLDGGGDHAIMIYTNITQVDTSGPSPKAIKPDILSESQYNDKSTTFKINHGNNIYVQYVEDECNFYYTPLFKSKTNLLPSKVIYPAVAGSGDGEIAGNWMEFTDYCECIRPLTLDYDQAAKKLWHISLLLERRPVGGTDADYVKVITLTSGKEGK